MTISAVTSADISFRPFDRVLNALRFRGCRVQQQRSGSVRCTCPVHRDARPSLVVSEKDGRVLLRCFAGCRTSDVLSAIGLRFSDLFDGSAPRIRSQVVATYPYTDLHGEIVAEKVRLQPKAFRWRRPDATARTGWRWGLDGTALPLYRWPDLIDATEVLLVEGEKAADRLAEHGFTVTCPAAGASTWQDRWTAQLLEAGCERLIVVPDNDREGTQHARRVAAACCDVMRVRVLTLPGLPSKGDIVDYLDAGNSAHDLRRLIDGSPEWTPDAEERERQARKREQARERKRKQRERQRQAIGHAVNVSSAA